MAKHDKDTDSPIPQAKLLRVLELIAIIKDKNKGNTTYRLAEQFKMSTRSIYRYIKLLEAVGFVIERDEDDGYFIFSSEHELGSTNFSFDQTSTLINLIKKSDLPAALRDSLLKTLSINSDIGDMPKVAIKLKNRHYIEKLSKAIKNKKQITLKRYHSANSNDIKDRLVEPFQFGPDYKTIIAFDTNDKKCKQFKLDRIGDILERKTKYKYEDLHKKTRNDIFGLSGDADTWITLKLTMRAYLLLKEEFPLSIPYIEKTSAPKSIVNYTFNGPVSNFEGIGRFVMGLIDQIEIKSPKTFLQFIRHKLQTSLNSIK